MTLETLPPRYQGVRPVALIPLLSARLAAHDTATEMHCRRVAILAVATGRALRLPVDRLVVLARAAIVHDVGKLAVSPALLRKPGPLSPPEYRTVQDHAAAGERLLRSLGMDAEASVVRHHHERIDGTGYPDRLCADAIPIESRIILAADAFDAMTAERPYRDRIADQAALVELRANAGTQFDPRCVAALARVVCRSGRYAALDEVDDVRRRAAGSEDLGDPELLEFGDVIRWDGPADGDDDVVGPLLPEKLHDFRHQRHMRARQDRQSDRVGIFLDHGLRDLLGRLV
jgi:hypothetical protein